MAGLLRLRLRLAAVPLAYPFYVLEWLLLGWFLLHLMSRPELIARFFVELVARGLGSVVLLYSEPEVSFESGATILLCV